MKKNYLFTICIITLIILSFVFFNKKISNATMQNVVGTITYNEGNKLIIKDEFDKTFEFKNDIVKDEVGTKVDIDCVGEIDKFKENQDCSIVDYEVVEKKKEENKEEQPKKEEENEIPDDYNDNGIFKDYYKNAYTKLKEMTLDEKISQLLIVHYPENDQTNIQSLYQFGGYIFFEKDFKGKTKDEVINMINNLNNVSKIKILTAIDEEGGKVSRISSNKNLVDTPFLSSQELYAQGGFNLIKEDVVRKSSILNSLGLNLNLAPVVDIANPSDYIYARTLGQNAFYTSVYAEEVIKSSKNTGVSYTLKHFPGYGSNTDTHKTGSVDTKSYEDILNNDLVPFIKGINAGAEAIMNSHNTVISIDPNNPVSLSSKAHEILRKDLNFTGVIITDDLNMKALENINNIEVKAINAGNDLLIVDNYEQAFNNIKNGINNKLVSEDTINRVVFRILAWKYYKGLIK